MSILRQVLAHPSNAGHPWRTTARWVVHNARRRWAPSRVMTIPVGERWLSGPADHPMVCLAVYMPAGGHDYEAFWALQRLLDPGDTFVDVGANIGIYSIQADPLVGREGRIIAIEPSPGQVVFLRQNLQRLEATTTLIPAAVADREREVGLEAPGPATGFLSASRPGRLALITTTLDEVLGSVDGGVAAHRCVVKIDIEGWEPAALAGARQLLIGGVRGFLIEARGHQSRSPVPWSKAVAQLHQHGYQFAWPEIAGRYRRLHEFSDPSPRSPFGDYLALSPEGHERLLRAISS